MLDRPSIINSMKVGSATPSPADWGDTRVIQYDAGGNRMWDGYAEYVPDSYGLWKSAKVYEYDALDRVASETTNYSFTGTPNGNPGGNVTCWTCDSVKLFYTYDANNNRTSVYDDMHVARYTSTYAYDALNRMIGFRGQVINCINY